MQLYAGYHFASWVKSTVRCTQCASHCSQALINLVFDIVRSVGLARIIWFIRTPELARLTIQKKEVKRSRKYVSTSLHTKIRPFGKRTDVQDMG